MMERRRFLKAAGTGVLAGVFSGLPLPVLAAENDKTAAQQFVRNLGRDAIETLAKASLGREAAHERFRVLLNQGFDVPYIAQFVLGRYWPTATPPQQKEYLELFEKLIVNAYADRFRQYSGETLEVAGSRDEGGSDLFVETQIVRPSGPPVAVAWRVRGAGKGMRIIDVVVEGVSMSATQRSEFASVIQSSGGIDGLLKALRQKVGKG